MLSYRLICKWILSHNLTYRLEVIAPEARGPWKRSKANQQRNRYRVTNTGIISAPLFNEKQKARSLARTIKHYHAGGITTN